MAAGLFLIPVVSCVALIVATAIAQPELLARDLSVFSTRVTGAVYGEDATQREAGREAMAPVAGATVACGRASAVTDAQGHYSLNQFPGRDYTCSVSAAGYATTSARIHAQFASSYALDFGSPSATAGGGACASASNGQRCGSLALQPGSISGVIVDSGTRKPLNSASVDCWDDSLAARTSMKDPARYSAVASSQGQYVVTDAPVGPYVCVAAQSGPPHPVVVRPGAVATLDIAACQNHCPGVSYHGGDVMNTFTAYVVYWTPPGKRLDPSGSDARFRSLVGQYLKDIGGAPFYGLLRQYWDMAGPVRNVARLGGTYVDTRPYPHAGTSADPLNDSDIYTEIARVSASQHWPVDPGVGFALITAYGIQTCASYEGHRSCSFPLNNDGGFCAYHSSTSYRSGNSTADYLPYMLVANVPGCDSLPTFDVGRAPYGAPVVDAVINSLSHEQFEMVSDPAGDGWYDNSDFSEIGDKCESSFGDPASDGVDVQLANGHGYALQREWSNTRNTCSYA
jgi:hypothetical protein